MHHLTSRITEPDAGAAAGRERTWWVTGLATAACAVSGSVASDPKSRWYEALDKPGWQPPSIAFPIVWTALYAGLVATSARTINELEARGEAQGATGYRGALAMNLLLNQGWSWTFFRARNLPVATANAALLAISSADLARRAHQASRGKAGELAPYALWCSFATVLTAAIARRNRS